MPTARPATRRDKPGNAHSLLTASSLPLRHLPARFSLASRRYTATPIARESKGSWSKLLKSAAGNEDTPRRYLALTRRPLVECYGSDELAARTQATDGRKAGPFKLGGRVSIIGGLLEFPIHRVDTIAHLCSAVLSVLPETRAIPGSEPLHMYAFLMCVQKSLRTVPPRALSV